VIYTTDLDLDLIAIVVIFFWRIRFNKIESNFPQKKKKKIPKEAETEKKREKC
jgi:hypothetical protein